MSTSTLIAHNKRFNSQIVTLDQLRALPPPVALGVRHKPISHATLIEGVIAEIERREFTPVRQQLAVSRDGEVLFGVIDLKPTAHNPLVLPALTDRGISFGLRSSTNSSFAIKAVAGNRVFVCDNLSMSGDLIAFLKKSTTGLDLGAAIATGFDKFIQQTTLLHAHIERLIATAVTDAEAKQLIFDVFNAAVVPVQLFKPVSRFYFTPTDEQTDCQPRTQWGLHNAFTRAVKELKPVSGFQATVALGRAFGMTDAGAKTL